MKDTTKLFIRRNLFGALSAVTLMVLAVLMVSFPENAWLTNSALLVIVSTAAYTLYVKHLKGYGRRVASRASMPLLERLPLVK
jgi:hypothetical protein